MTSNPDSMSVGDAPEILIGLGANIANGAVPPAQTLKHALAALQGRGVAILRVSPFYETRAWPDPTDPPFVNAVAVARSQTQPVALLALLHEVETELGRKRSAPNAPRTLDLDLLAYGGVVMDGPLVLPHPRLAGRRFVLEPLKDVSPGWRHPVSGRTVAELLASIP
jgi:2-amino-4-hydroxy-6-hydroxymethyldihydropteridine diphosphokinase